MPQILTIKSWGHGAHLNGLAPQTKHVKVLYILVNCLSDAPVAPTSLSSYCFATRKNTAGHSFLSARTMYIENLKDSLLVFFRRVNWIIMYSVETNRKIFNRAKNSVIVCGYFVEYVLIWRKFFDVYMEKNKTAKEKTVLDT